MKRVTPERLSILEAMDATTEYRLCDLAALIGRTIKLTGNQMVALESLGLIQRVRYGRYSLTPDWRANPALILTMPTTAPQVAYLLRCGEYYKIGISNNVAQRIADLQTASPHEIVYLCSIVTDDAAQLEAELHQQYATKHVRGEWFKLDIWDVEELIALAESRASS